MSQTPSQCMLVGHISLLAQHIPCLFGISKGRFDLSFSLFLFFPARPWAAGLKHQPVAAGRSHPEHQRAAGSLLSAPGAPGDAPARPGRGCRHLSLCWSCPRPRGRRGSCSPAPRTSRGWRCRRRPAGWGRLERVKALPLLLLQPPECHCFPLEVSLGKP